MFILLIECVMQCYGAKWCACSLVLDRTLGRRGLFVRRCYLIHSSITLHLIVADLCFDLEINKMIPF